MNKLIATTFDYTADVYNGRRTEFGSYLGHKQASEQTIRRFLNKNARDCGAEFKLRSVAIRGSYVSQWIAK